MHIHVSQALPPFEYRGDLLLLLARGDCEADQIELADYFSPVTLEDRLVGLEQRLLVEAEIVDADDAGESVLEVAGVGLDLADAVTDDAMGVVVEAHCSTTKVCKRSLMQVMSWISLRTS